MAIAVRLKGGLGNQLFQYCFGRSLAVFNKTHLILDASYLDQNSPIPLFNYPISSRLANTGELVPYSIYESRDITNIIHRTLNYFTPREKRLVVYEDSLDYNPKIVPLSSDYRCYDGYWQSIYYWKAHQEVILSELSAPRSQFFNQDLTAVQYVAVHVRLGDFLDSKFHLKLPLDYYQRAVNEIHKYIKNPVFILFSNNINQAQAFLEPLNIRSIQIAGHHSELPNNFDGMSSCRHFIMANSTYSWWASYLSPYQRKIIIAPRRWYISANSHHIHRDDMILL